jgi:DNA-binding HxlR family transcriptional regulator
MRWDDVGNQTCSIARSLAVVGDRWTLLVLREAFGSARRFEHFQRRVGASRPIVADRLGRLVEHGILERRAYQERPPRFEYRLTRKGSDLQPVLLALMAWGDRWMDGGAGRPLELVHRECGCVATPRLDCDGCGEPLTSQTIRLRPGPALRRLDRGAGG